MVERKTMEKFSIPGVAGIIEKTINGQCHILLQQRVKDEAPAEKGLLEIPAGKIREFEDIYACLRREVFEETGLTVTEIHGHAQTTRIHQHAYTVIGFEPFYVSQNLTGTYPIMVLTFICQAEGTLKRASQESENLRWCSIETLSHDLTRHPERFYPMHVASLTKYLSTVHHTIKQ
jgi:8-oxo-dGTP pyrophosphatase MutT (NUDIX family)